MDLFLSFKKIKPQSRIMCLAASCLKEAASAYLRPRWAELWPQDNKKQQKWEHNGPWKGSLCSVHGTTDWLMKWQHLETGAAPDVAPVSPAAHFVNYKMIYKYELLNKVVSRRCSQSSGNVYVLWSRLSRMLTLQWKSNRKTVTISDVNYIKWIKWWHLPKSAEGQYVILSQFK